MASDDPQQNPVERFEVMVNAADDTWVIDSEEFARKEIVCALGRSSADDFSGQSQMTYYAFWCEFGRFPSR